MQLATRRHQHNSSDGSAVRYPLFHMETILVNVLSFRGLPYQVAADQEEFDRLAKRVGAMKDEANRNVLYRGILPIARDGFLHGLEAEKDEAGDEVRPAIDGLEELTKIERKTRVTKAQEKDANGNITQEEKTAWDETESKYEERVYATLVKDGQFPTVEAAVAAYQPLMAKILEAIPFDPSKEPRQSGPKKTPKTYYEIADAIIEGAGSLENAVAAFNTKTGRNVEVSRDALAKGVWEDQAAKRKTIAAQYV